MSVGRAGDLQKFRPSHVWFSNKSA